MTVRLISHPPAGDPNFPCAALTRVPVAAGVVNGDGDAYVWSIVFIGLGLLIIVNAPPRNTGATFVVGCIGIGIGLGIMAWHRHGPRR